MATSTKEIIAYLEKNYPQKENQIGIANCPDRNFRFNGKVLNQYIIGVSPSDPFSPGISHYEHNMREKLADISQNVVCVPWPFYGYETEEMKASLREIAEHFKVKLDIDRMIKDLKIPRDEGGVYYIVVTVIQYIIAYVE